MENSFEQLARMATLLARWFPEDGVHATAVERMSIIRASQPNAPLHMLHQPAVCIIVQGNKRVMLGGEVYDYDTSRYLVVTADLPLSGQVTRATAREPYLCFRLDLDPAVLAELTLQVGPPASRPPGTTRGLFLDEPHPALLDAVLRLVRLLETPEDIPLLAPLTTREILYRLLKSEQGWRLQQIAIAGAHAHRIARAIDWLKVHYAEPLRIEHLARQVHMSTSSLHHQFKAVTAMSPLQYQKQLRLQEARRLMINEGLDAASAGFRVGYESASQFGREYHRLFGAPPATDLRRLRQQLDTGMLGLLSGDALAQNVTP